MAVDTSQYDGAGDRQSDLAVMDANEYKQKRRLERILDAMDGVEATADAAYDELVAGQISADAKNIMVQRAVKEAVRESYKLLIDHFRAVTDNADENGEQAWDRYWTGDPGDALGVVELDRDDNHFIQGLRDYLEAPTYFVEEWSEQEHPRDMAPQEVTRSREHTMPEDVSWAAFLRLKEFLDEKHDLEISFEEMDDSLPVWGFEEVPKDAEDESGDLEVI